MGFGPDPWTAKGVLSSGERLGAQQPRFLVVQRRGEHVIELGHYGSKKVARVALEEMVAKGFPREELSVRRSKADLE